MNANSNTDARLAAGERLPVVSDQMLNSIVEQGFFGSPGSLAKARAACAELLFARAMIRAQTDRIAQLDLRGVHPTPPADAG